MLSCIKPWWQGHVKVWKWSSFYFQLCLLGGNISKQDRDQLDKIVKKAESVMQETRQVWHTVPETTDKQINFIIFMTTHTVSHTHWRHTHSLTHPLKPHSHTPTEDTQSHTHWRHTVTHPLKPHSHTPTEDTQSHTHWRHTVSHTHWSHTVTHPLKTDFDNKIIQRSKCFAVPRIRTAWYAGSFLPLAIKGFNIRISRS